MVFRSYLIGMVMLNSNNLHYRILRFGRIDYLGKAELPMPARIKLKIRSFSASSKPGYRYHTTIIPHAHVI